jgi:hypothetical protein
MGRPSVFHVGIRGRKFQCFISLHYFDDRGKGLVPPRTHSGHAELLLDGESEARESSQSFAKSPSFRRADHVLNRIRPVAHAELNGSLFESTFEVHLQDRFQFTVPLNPLRLSKRTSR